jgi:hypothetical protein
MLRCMVSFEPTHLIIYIVLFLWIYVLALLADAVLVTIESYTLSRCGVQLL